MISIERGTLEIYNVDLELVVESQFFVDRWVMLSLFRAEQLVLRGVSITIANSLRHPAAMVELLPPDMQEFSDLMSEPIRRPAARVDFANSLLRGEADLFQIDSADAARIRLDNVAVALNGSMMMIRGIDTLDLPVGLTPEEAVELTMQHVTAVLSRPLIDIDVRPDYAVPSLIVDARDSVVVIPEGPLVAMRGDYDEFDFRNLLSWSGSHNVLEVRDPVWRIASEVSFATPREFTFEQWLDVWRRSSRSERRTSERLLQMRDDAASGSARGSFATWSVDDFRLRMDGPLLNPAVDSASDGHDAGIQLNLDRIPAGPTTAITSTTPSAQPD